MNRHLRPPPRVVPERPLLRFEVDFELRSDGVHPLTPFRERVIVNATCSVHARRIVDKRAREAHPRSARIVHGVRVIR